MEAKTIWGRLFTLSVLSVGVLFIKPLACVCWSIFVLPEVALGYEHAFLGGFGGEVQSAAPETDVFVVLFAVGEEKRVGRIKGGAPVVFGKYGEAAAPVAENVRFGGSSDVGFAVHESHAAVYYGLNGQRLGKCGYFVEGQLRRRCNGGYAQVLERQYAAGIVGGKTKPGADGEVPGCGGKYLPPLVYHDVMHLQLFQLVKIGQQQAVLVVMEQMRQYCADFCNAVLPKRRDNAGGGQKLGDGYVKNLGL